ncbi:hypothetical protein Ancab_023235 [Ancistrocladus abbreviatus]
MSLSSPPPIIISFSFLLFLLTYSSAQKQNSNSLSSFSISDSPWLPSQNRTLRSPKSTFSAGFLPLTNSPNLYNFSIWYTTISEKAIVWSVKSPLAVSASLTITVSGELRLTNSSSAGENLWPRIATGKNSSKLLLEDSGNLVFGDWESFSYPTDTFLPNQTMNGKQLTSANGNYNFNGTNLVFNPNDSYWGTPEFQQLGPDGELTMSGSSIYSSDFESILPRRLTLDNDGNLRMYSWNKNTTKWVVVWQAIQEICTVHGLCGPNSICLNDGSSDSISCVCPFQKSGSGECEIPYNGSNPGSSKFLRLDYVNYTGSNPIQPNVQNFTMCESKCLNDPKCVGFGFKYDGSGYCSLQFGQLKNGYWSPGTQAAAYIRVNRDATPAMNFTGMTEVLETTCPLLVELPDPPEESKTTTRNIAIITILFSTELIIGAVSFWAFLKKYVKYREMARTLGLELLPAGGPKRFSYADIKAATDNFSNDNMIGRGGFGDVYKGILPDHRVVAVKCLKNVAGGDAEFWAEVTIIARMHHLNLVRLWGFCNEKGQRILVYEYVPNGSMDKYLFRSQTRALNRINETDTEPEYEEKPILDWNIRYRIAVGVARAIAYLHEECLEWVLHCDIKPENILLGDDFCPKISDFGLSKLRKKEQAVSKSRIRGTRGYMAPEWVKNDSISSKADVYSFGMVLLEIVSGTRNFDQQESSIESAEWYFPKWAFEKVMMEMKVEDILDRQIKDLYDSKQHFKMVERMVKTAIWCLQERPDMRPSMGKVAKMLEGTVEIMEPPRPTIFYAPDE